MTLVTITLNGDPAEVEEGTSLAALLAELRVMPERVVVEHNTRVLRAPDLDSAVLRAGDEVEVVHFVGGG
jgi:thiamine biosynthesis protein ThiS